jgi:hypothetical protein
MKVQNGAWQKVFASGPRSLIGVGPGIQFCRFAAFDFDKPANWRRFFKIGKNFRTVTTIFVTTDNRP